MKISAIREIPYYLPLFFYTLSLAPNYTGDSILLGLISINIVYVLSVKLIGDSINSPNKLTAAITSLVLIAIYILLNYSSAFMLIFAAISLIIIVYTSTKNKILADSITGVSIFILAYIALTGYGLEQLIQWKIAIGLLPPLLFFTCYKSKIDKRWAFILFLIAFSITSYTVGTTSYLWILSIIFIPRLIEGFREINTKFVEIFTVTALNIFLVYYVLYSTYLIQALQGGY